MVDWDDLHRWKMIDKELGLPFADPIETYSTSEHVYTGLGIPAGTTGKLPKDKRVRAGLSAERAEDLGGKQPKPPRDRAKDKPKAKPADRAKAPAKDKPKDAEKPKDAAKPKRRRNRTRSGKPASAE